MKNFSFVCKKTQSLNSFLQSQLPLVLKNENISNSKIRRLIVAGGVRVNSAQIRIPAFTLRPNSEVEVFIDEEKFFYEKENDDIDFVLTEKDVLFEDEYLIVVNKPAFLPTEATIVKDRKNLHASVVDYLWKKNPSLRNPPYAGIMHRLDRETSGAILFTKARSVNKEISEMFQNRSLEKKYVALCTNKFNKKIPHKFSVEKFIGRVSAKSDRCKIGEISESKGGQFSKTDFELIEEKNGEVKFSCLLHTGRTHQIRVHLSLSGYPIKGDELYGGINSQRICLHSSKLEFIHPVTKEKVLIISKEPF